MEMTPVSHRDAAPTEAPPPLERRQGKRHTSVLLIGRADFDGREHACLVHNISERGLMARFLSPPAVGDVLTIHLRGLGPAEATVRWTREACAGMEFSVPQALEPVLHATPSEDVRARTPRFDVSRLAHLEVGDARFDVDVVDASVALAELAAAPPLHIGSHARLLIDGTALIYAGTICWQRDDRTGFQFVTPLTLQRLADLLD